MKRHDVRLDGCSPEPLAHYLKALAILRLVAEQVDPGASGAWAGDAFVLRSTLDHDGLSRFFLDTWQPTPVIAPWNGGSGFHPGDNTSGIVAIEGSDLARLAPYRDAIRAARDTLQAMGLTAKPEKEVKLSLIERLRSELPDGALAWLDAAVNMTADAVRYPPLLGTGGNDGRLDFSNNFMQQVGALVGADRDVAFLAAALEGALTGAATRKLIAASVGQFFPSAAGGLNAGPGFEANGRVNPWDYVWMIEGALMFAAATTRKLDAADPGAMVFPFAVRASGAGYASGADADEGETRDEMWLPLWSRFATLRDLRALIGEGRCTVRGRDRARPATNAVDFARALGQLGVDHGVDQFTRYGFHVRNGLAYQAVPLGRWRATSREAVDLISGIDDWMSRFRRLAADDRAPASLGRLRRQLEQAVLDLCRTGQVEPVLTTLGAIELQMNASRSFCLDKGLPPVPWLDKAWAQQCNDGSATFRLACALASRQVTIGKETMSFRRRFSSVVSERFRVAWTDTVGREQTWGPGGVERNLTALLLREQSEAASASSAVGVSLGDLQAWFDGAVDEARLERLTLGLALVTGAPPLASAGGGTVPTLYALMALTTLRNADAPAPRAPGMLRRALAGDALGASTAALLRLRGNGRAALLPNGFALGPDQTRRCATALAFPLHPAALDALARHHLVTPEPELLP